MRVTFLNPGDRTDPFTDRLAGVMEAAAADLGVDLAVEDCGRDAERIRDRAFALADADPRPDAVVLSNLESVTATVLPHLDRAGLDVFLINEGLMASETGVVGGPREKYRHWVGELIPDEKSAGELLARALLDAADRAGLRAADGTVRVCGLAGSYTYSAIHRLNGLRTEIARRDDAELLEVQPAGWSKARAKEMTADLLDRAPDATVFWAASDLMAIGALEAAREAGRAPGKDVVLGGVDWTDEACDHVGKGELAATVGGHFFEGAWAVVLLHDRHHGVDFENPRMQSRFAVMTPETRARYAPLLDRRAWESLDFRRFSRAADPAVAAWDFSPDAVLRQLGA